MKIIIFWGDLTDSSSKIEALLGAHATAVVNWPDSQWNVLFVVPIGLIIADVSVIHLVSRTYVQAAQAMGGTANMQRCADI